MANDSSTQTSMSSGLTSAMPVVGAALDVGGGFLGGLFNANQARKNRKFQERMYNKQVEDNIRFWEMQNRYNLPSAVKQRLEDANLNPLLMYGDGASGVTAASPIQSGTAPHGAQGAMSSHTNFGQALTQSALIQAQIRNINADTEQKQASAENSRQSSESIYQDILLKRLTRDVNVALAHGQLDFLNTSMQEMQTNMMNSTRLTTQQILTYIQGRQYQIKQYNLDFDVRGEQLQQGWKSLDLEEEHNKIQWRGLALEAMRITNETKMTNAQVGMLQWSLLKDKAMFLPQFEGLSLDNKLKRWDTHLKKANLSEKQRDIFNKDLRNYYLYQYGKEELPSSWIFDHGKVLDQTLKRGNGTRQPAFQDIYVLPWQKK